MYSETDPDAINDGPIVSDNGQIRFDESGLEKSGEGQKTDLQFDRTDDGTPDSLNNIDQSTEPEYAFNSSSSTESEEIPVIENESYAESKITTSLDTDESIGNGVTDEEPDPALHPVHATDSDLPISMESENETFQDSSVSYTESEPYSTIENAPAVTHHDPGISDMNDSLYYITSQWNLHYLISQGYIGAVSERAHYTDDIPECPKGYIPLFARTLGLDLLRHVTEVKGEAVCAIEIPVADLVHLENVVAIGQYHSAINWTQSAIRTVAALIPGAIFIKSHYRILTRSEVELSELTRGSSSGLRHVPYSRFEFTPDHQNTIFSNEISNKLFLISNVQTDKDPEQINELFWLDNALDRLAGGLSAALWLTNCESNEPPEIDLVSNWSKSVFEGGLRDRHSLQLLLDEMFKSIPGIDQSRKEVDEWIFNQISIQLLETPIEVAPGEREIVDGLREKIDNLSDLEETKKSLLIESIERLEDYLDVSSNSVLGPGDRFTSFRALLIALQSIIVSPDPEGLEFWLSSKKQHHSVLMVAALWIGMLTGRRKTELKFRTPEFDNTIAEWSSNQLTQLASGVSGIRWTDNNPVLLESVPPIPGADGIRLQVGERVLFERKPSLFSVFSHSEPRSSITQNAAQTLCSEMGDKWTADCVRTKIRFRNAIFQGVNRVNQQTWEIELSGTPTEVIHEADIGQLVKTLQESENEVPEDTKTRILELFSGS